MDAPRLNGGFAPLYNAKVQELMLARTFIKLHVLITLAAHCDELGLCRPGIARIALFAACGEDDVQITLEQLERDEYLRIHHTTNPLRRNTEIDYQLSPYVIHIREDKLQMAWDLWKSVATQLAPVKEGDLFLGNNQILLNQNHNQILNQNQETRPTTTTRIRDTPEGDKRKKRSAKNLQNEGKDKNNDSDHEPQRAAQQPAHSAAENPPPRSAPPPPSGNWTQPLPQEEKETLAHQLMAVAPTRLGQARQLVSQYPETHVRLAMRHLAQEVSKGTNIKTPFGLVKSWLQKNYIALDDEPQADSRKNDALEQGDWYQQRTG